jgi:GH24 family phage-related lysozyme (muramidase)
LVSFTFNIKAEEFLKSKLLERLLAGEDPNLVAREEIPRYRYYNKVIEDGKIMRKVL